MFVSAKLYILALIFPVEATLTKPDLFSSDRKVFFQNKLAVAGMLLTAPNSLIAFFWYIIMPLQSCKTFAKSSITKKTVLKEALPNTGFYGQIRLSQSEGYRCSPQILLAAGLVFVLAGLVIGLLTACVATGLPCFTVFLGLAIFSINNVTISLQAAFDIKPQFKNIGSTL